MWAALYDPRMLRIVALALSSPEARSLEERHSAEVTVRYGGGDTDPPLDAAPFEPPRGAFFVAFLDVDGGEREPVGCAGFRPLDAEPATAEIKRMFVVAEARGRGIARALLARLEDVAVERGYSSLWLETGTAQPEAMALYESEGYDAIPNYGEHRDEPRTRSYAKRLV